MSRASRRLDAPYGPAFWAKYVLFFCVVGLASFIPFTAAGKSFIWSVDGAFQHYNAFIYIGCWIRQLVSGLLPGRPFAIPMWNWSIGYGGDVITTLAYYGIADPFTWISAFFPVRYSEAGYELSILIRLFCAGAGFIIFARLMGARARGALCGAIAYAYCGFAMLMCLRHPFFADALVWLPLVLAGMERVLRGMSPVPYMVTATLAAASNFYFFYMVALLAILYGLFRGWDLFRPSIRALSLSALRVLLYSVIGVLAAAIVFLPAAMALLGSGRGGNGYEFSFFMTPGEYLSLLASPVTYRQLYGPNFYNGVSPVVFFGAVSALLTRRGDAWARRLLILEGIFLLLPAVSYAFNGLSYVSYRWTFGLVFLACYLFARTADDLFDMDARREILVSVFACVYAVCCGIASYWLRVGFPIGALVPVVFLIVALPSHKLRSTSKASPRTAALCVFTAAGIIMNSWVQLSVPGRYSLERFMYDGQGRSELYGRYFSAASSIADDDFYRVETADSPNSDVSTNFPLTSGLSSTAGYWSIMPGENAGFMMDNSAYTSEIDRNRGLQSRSWLLPLAGARYFVTWENRRDAVPAGYRFARSKSVRVMGNRRTAYLYRTDNALPLGYTYSSFVDESDWRKMSFARRQQVMLQAAVVSSADFKAASESAGATLPEASAASSGTALPEVSSASSGTSLKFSDRTLSMTPLSTKGCELSGNKIVAAKENAEITFACSAPAGRELCLQILGLEFKASSGLGDEIAGLRASSGGLNSAMSKYYESGATYTSGRTDYFMNMFTSERERKRVTLRLDTPGTYTFRSMSLVSQGISSIPELVRQRSAARLTNVRRGTNTVRGTVKAPAARVLAFSIPYSEGWSLTIDGKPQRLIRVNGMYMGTVIPKGRHSVALSYRTPYLVEGALFSADGILLIILTAVRWKRKRKA